MIVVLEIPMIAPAKTLSIRVKPSICPTRYPSGDHDAALEQSDGAGLLTHLDQLPDAELEAEREHQQDHTELGERANGSGSATSGIWMCGPMIIPASRYPKTTGWCSRWNTTVATAATQRTTARFWRKECESISAPVGSLRKFATMTRMGNHY